MYVFIYVEEKKDVIIIKVVHSLQILPTNIFTTHYFEIRYRVPLSLIRRLGITAEALRVVNSEFQVYTFFHRCINSDIHVQNQSSVKKKKPSTSIPNRPTKYNRQLELSP